MSQYKIMQLEFELLRERFQNNYVFYFVRKGKGKKEEEKPKEEEEFQIAPKIQEEVTLEKLPWLPPFDFILLDYINDASKTILPLATTKEQVVALAQ